MFQDRRPERSSWPWTNSSSRSVKAACSASASLNLKRIACNSSQVATTTAWRRNDRAIPSSRGISYAGVLRKTPTVSVTSFSCDTRYNAILQRSTIRRAALLSLILINYSRFLAVGRPRSLPDTRVLRQNGHDEPRMGESAIQPECD